MSKECISFSDFGGKWFECKIKYTKIDNKTGKDKTVTEPYLVNAVTWGEAEERIFKEAETLGIRECEIKIITPRKYEEIHAYEADGYWFKCKITFLDTDETSGKEVKTNSEILINAENTKQADERIKECLKNILVPFAIRKIEETAIIDIFPYEPKD